MGLFHNIKKMFSGSGIVTKSESETVIEPALQNEAIRQFDGFLNRRALEIADQVMPYACGEDFMGLFKSVPEVFFPIDYIASRVAGAQFQVKKTKDDSIVWRNKPMNSILSKPNCMMSFREFVYQHFINRLVTGNSFVRAAMPETFVNSLKFEMCSNFWVLPSTSISIKKPRYNGALYGVADMEDLVEKYSVEADGRVIDIPQWQVWHDRDGSISSYEYMKSTSRLKSQVKPISNLIAVYEARNVIYVKRGGLGFLVNTQTDVSGSVALRPDEVKELLTQQFEKYGLKSHQLPYAWSNTPLEFIRTNLSIEELMPFDETLADAISIAGAYGIPPVLVPRKDQSTFNNQANAEKSVYSSQIIPLCKQFCKDFGRFLGLEEKDLYMDCDFSHVDCLQQGVREAEATKTSVNNRCKSQFENGLISINDWRAQIGESKLESTDFPEVFDKVKFLMSDEELQYINRIFNHQSSVENGRENQKPAVQDEGK